MSAPNCPIVLIVRFATAMAGIVMSVSCLASDSLARVQGGLRQSKEALGSLQAVVQETNNFSQDASRSGRDNLGKRVTRYEWAVSGDKIYRAQVAGAGVSAVKTVQVSDGKQERVLSAPPSAPTAPSLSSGYFSSKSELAHAFNLLNPGYLYDGQWIADLVSNGTFALIPAPAPLIGLEGKVSGRVVSFTIDPTRGYLVVASRAETAMPDVVQVGRTLDAVQVGDRWLPTHVSLEGVSSTDGKEKLLSRWELKALDLKPSAPDKLFALPAYPSGSVVFERNSWRPYKVLDDGNMVEIEVDSAQRQHRMVVGWMFVGGLTLMLALGAMLLTRFGLAPRT
jgi:hypothetical protein